MSDERDYKTGMPLSVVGPSGAVPWENDESYSYWLSKGRFPLRYRLMKPHEAVIAASVENHVFNRKEAVEAYQQRQEVIGLLEQGNSASIEQLAVLVRAERYQQAITGQLDVANGQRAEILRLSEDQTATLLESLGVQHHMVEGIFDIRTITSRANELSEVAIAQREEMSNKLDVLAEQGQYGIHLDESRNDLLLGLSKESAFQTKLQFGMLAELHSQGQTLGQILDSSLYSNEQLASLRVEMSTYAKETSYHLATIGDLLIDVNDQLSLVTDAINVSNRVLSGIYTEVNETRLAVIRGFEKIGNVLQWMHAEQIWELRTQTIAAITPRRTRAKETWEIGKKLLSSGKRKRSERQFLLSIDDVEGDPTFFQGHLSLGVLRMMQYKYRQSLQHLKDALSYCETEGERCEVLPIIARVQFCLNRHHDAFTTLSQALQISPNNSELLFDAAKYASYAGNLAIAESFLAKALVINPEIGKRAFVQPDAEFLQPMIPGILPQVASQVGKSNELELAEVSVLFKDFSLAGIIIGNLINSDPVRFFQSLALNADWVMKIPEKMLQNSVNSAVKSPLVVRSEHKLLALIGIMVSVGLDGNINQAVDGLSSVSLDFLRQDSSGFKSTCCMILGLPKGEQVFYVIKTSNPKHFAWMI